MTKRRTFGWFAPMAAVMGLALLGLLALGFSSSATAGAEGDGGSLMARLHQHLAGHGGSHGGGHHRMHHGFGHFIGELDLTEAQQQNLSAIHHALMDGLAGHGEGRAEQRSRLLESVERGDLTVAEVQVLVDEHLEAMRTVGYEIAEPLTELVNSFDPEQRARMVAHIKALHGEDS